MKNLSNNKTENRQDLTRFDEGIIPVEIQHEAIQSLLQDTDIREWQDSLWKMAFWLGLDDLDSKTHAELIYDIRRLYGFFDILRDSIQQGKEIESTSEHAQKDILNSKVESVLTIAETINVVANSNMNEGEKTSKIIELAKTCKERGNTIRA